MPNLLSFLFFSPKQELRRGDEWFMDHKETHDEGLNFLIDSIIYSLVQSHTLIWDEYAKERKKERDIYIYVYIHIPSLKLTASKLNLMVGRRLGLWVAKGPIFEGTPTISFREGM